VQARHTRNGAVADELRPSPARGGDALADDAQNECIDEPETKHGFEGEDGCPDDPNQAKAHGPAKPKKK